MKCILMFIAMLALPLTTQASVIGFNFFLGGFSEGAFITGYAIGNDLNNDGRLHHSTPIPLDLGVIPPPSEIQQFSLAFSGNSKVDAFTLDDIHAFSQPPYAVGGFDEGFFFSVGPHGVDGQGAEWESFFIDGDLNPGFCGGVDCLGFTFTGAGISAFSKAQIAIFNDACGRHFGSCTGMREISSESDFTVTQIASVSEPGMLALLLVGLCLIRLTRALALKRSCGVMTIQ